MTKDSKRFTLDDMTDDRVEILIGSLLRIGVIVSAVVVSIGAILLFSQHFQESLSFAVFAGEPRFLRNVFAISASAAQLKGRSVIQFGIILLIATPIARVLLSLVAFYIQKDRMYVVMTLIVLTILLYSLSGGY